MQILFLLSVIRGVGYTRSSLSDYTMERSYTIYNNNESNPSWVLTSLAEQLYRIKKLSMTPSNSNANYDALTTVKLNETEFMDSARLWFSTVESSNEKINYCKSLCASSDIYNCSYTAECLLVFAKETKHTWKIRHLNVDSKIYVSNYNDSFEIKTRDDIINILNQNKLIYSSFCFNISLMSEEPKTVIRNDYSYLSNTKECKESPGTYLISFVQIDLDNEGTIVGGYTTHIDNIMNNHKYVVLCNETGDSLVNNFGIFNFNAIVEIGEKEDEKENCDNTNNASIDGSNNSTSTKSSKKEKTYLGLMITFLIMFVASVPLSIIFTIKYAQMKSLETSNSADRGISVNV